MLIARLRATSERQSSGADSHHDVVAALSLRAGHMRYPLETPQPFDSGDGKRGLTRTPFSHAVSSAARLVSARLASRPTSSCNRRSTRPSGDGMPRLSPGTAG